MPCRMVADENCVGTANGVPDNVVALVRGRLDPAHIYGINKKIQIFKKFIFSSGFGKKCQLSYKTESNYIESSVIQFGKLKRLTRNLKAVLFKLKYI